MIFEFLLWTFCLYWIHRVIHKIPQLKKIHFAHHRFIAQNPNVGWHWNNLLLINDDVESTIDLWITEVIPTLLLSFLLNAWWLSIFYYLWAALIQERIEHDANFNLPPLTSGGWHLIHHKKVTVNYGLFFPFWDIIFRTNEKLHTR